MIAGNIRERIYAGYGNENNTVTGNTLYMIGGTVLYAYGGAGAGTGLVSENSLTFSDAAQAEELYGGLSIGSGNAEGNSVAMNGGTLAWGILGGQANNGKATGNSVTITGGAVGTYDEYDPDGNIYSGWLVGGYGKAGASGNTVTFSGSSTSANNINGGESASGNVSSNRVTISGGTVLGAGGIRGGWSETGTVSGNTVEILGGTLRSISGGMVGGTTPTGSVTGNSVTISGGTMSTVDGGLSVSGDVTNNTVTVTGVTAIGSILGGRSDGANTVVSGNSVFVTGGDALGVVVGGQAMYGETFNAGPRTITNNMISVSGGVWREGSYISGAYGEANGDVLQNNVVRISGTPDLSGVYLFGAMKNGVPYDTWQTDGNTLKIDGFTGNVLGLANFRNYEFRLPSSLSSGDVVLAVKDALTYRTISTDITGTMVTIGFYEASTSLAPGDRFTLIDASTQELIGKPANVDNSINAIVGGKIYTFALSVENDKLVAEVTSVKGAPLGGSSSSCADGAAGGMAIAGAAAFALMRRKRAR